MRVDCLRRLGPVCGALATLACAGPSCVDQPDEQELRNLGRTIYWQIGRTYHDHTRKRLAHQLYARAEDPGVVMELLAIEPGEVVADIGCGAGFYTLPLLEATGPGGTVYAVDIQEESLEFLRERVAAVDCRGCGEMVTVVNRADDAMLPAGSVDVGLMAFLDFYAFADLLDENVRMLESCYSALAPGGRLVVFQDMTAVVGGSVEAMSRNFRSLGLVEERSHVFPGTDRIGDFPGIPADEPPPEDTTVALVFRKPVSTP